MPTHEMLEVVCSCSLFKGFNDKEKYYILRFFQKEFCQKNKIIVHEGQTITDFYIVAQGEWEVFLPEKYRPSEVRLQVLGKGALIGEYSFLDQSFASASVRSIDDGILYKIGRDEFEQIVESSNRIGKLIYKNMLEGLIARLRNYNDEKDLLNMLDG